MILTLVFVSFFSSLILLYLVIRYLENDRLSSGDTFFHLLISRSIQKQQLKYPTSFPNVRLIESEKKYNYLIYPPLLHYIIALFPAKSHLTVAKNLNLVLLSMLSSIAAISAYNFTANFWVGLLASFIVGFNLSIFEMTAFLTPRPLGLVFYSLILYIAIFYPQNCFSVLVIGFLVMLVTLSHKFAVQMLVIGLPLYSLFFNRPYLLLSIILGFAMSILVSRGFYFKILKEHFSWLQFYSRHRPTANFVKKWIAILARNSWWLALISLIVLLIIQHQIWYTDVAERVLFWALIPLLTAFLVSIPQLAFIGEDYRYVEYSLVPTAVLVPAFMLMTKATFFVLFLFLVCLSISILALIKYKVSLTDSKFLVQKEDISAYASLKNYITGYLLVFPQWRALEVSYFTNLPIIHLVRKSRQSDSEILDDLINKYGAQFFLKYKGTDPYQFFKTLSNLFSLKKIFESRNFEVYRLCSI